MTEMEMVKHLIWTRAGLEVFLQYLTVEFDIRVVESGRLAVLRYANSTNYRKEATIRKEVTISWPVVQEFKRIVAESEIIKYVFLCSLTANISILTTERATKSGRPKIETGSKSWKLE
jgi:hypothetical protein